MTSLVMTILGEDRPGVVESVAEIVNEHGANWLESRMAHLAGQFAGIVHVEVNPGKVDALIEALRSLDQQGLTVIVQAEAAQETHDSFAPLQLEVVGSDQPGIVREVSRVLAGRNVNVEEFQTECVSAPMSGEKLFRATAQLRLPTDLTVLQLQQELEEIASDLMVDIRLKSD
ncbi:MAG: ACT domain-containing protein [Pirellulaceae bacterium]|nr:ACT domain-containing protein [Pirellulaceae bacterium]